MKITQATLKKIIKEEIANMFNEDAPRIAKADEREAGMEAGEIESEKTAKKRPGVFTEEDETVDEAHCVSGDRDDDRHPKRDLDDLYAMVRDLERRLDKMDG